MYGYLVFIKLYIIICNALKYIYTTCTYIRYFSTVIFVLPSYQSLPVTLLHRVHWIQTELGTYITLC